MAQRRKSTAIYKRLNIWEQPILVGPVLQFDSAREQFTGEYSEAANRYLKYDYREPFVIPDKI